MDNKGKPSGIRCPITGSDLLYAGHDEDCRDASHYYVSAANPNIFFWRHPFQWDIFHLDPERPFDLIQVWSKKGRMPEEEYKAEYEKAKPVSNALKLYGRYKRCYRLADDGTWTALVRVAYGFAPAETSLEMLDRLEDEDRLDYERRKAEFIADPEKHAGFLFRVQPSTVATELVSVQPMSAPNGTLFFLDVMEPDGPRYPASRE